jgi:hypothetical protein
MANLALGENVRYKPDTRMIKFSGSPKVFAIGTHGLLRWVTTEAVAATLFGSDWNQQIDDLSDAFYINYNMGADIASPSEYTTPDIPDISADLFGS